MYNEFPPAKLIVLFILGFILLFATIQLTGDIHCESFTGEYVACDQLQFEDTGYNYEQ